MTPNFCLRRWQAKLVRGDRRPGIAVGGRSGVEAQTPQTVSSNSALAVVTIVPTFAERSFWVGQETPCVPLDKAAHSRQKRITASLTVV